MPSPFSLTSEQAEGLASSVAAGTKLRFCNQANRNWVAKIAKRKGVMVVKGSSRNQAIDPRYVVDAVAEGRIEDYTDHGLANQKQFFGVLYNLEKDGWR